VGATNLAALAWACATIGWQFVAVLYLQQVLGYTALATRLGIVPMGLAIVIAANLAGRLISRWGLGRVAIAGLPGERQGLASGLVTSAVQIGAGIGVAVLAAMMTLGGSTPAGYRIAFLTAGRFSRFGALVAAFGLRPRRLVPAPIA
jgi:hypothetical protein